MLLSGSFLRASLRAAGGGVGTKAQRSRQRHFSQFGSGLGRTLRRKEWRLLCRDHSIFAQLSLQIIYTVPLAVVLMRGVDNIPLALAIAPAIVVIAAQIAASLAWITVSGEYAPELIAAAPVLREHVELAKVTAIGVPVLVILAIPLAGLALLSPFVALMVALFAAAAGISTALLNLWHPMPGNRRGMLRRHSQSKLIALLEHLMAMLWAIAIVLAVVGSAWARCPLRWQTSSSSAAASEQPWRFANQSAKLAPGLTQLDPLPYPSSRKPQRSADSGPYRRPKERGGSRIFAATGMTGGGWDDG
jgi:ABC-2 type transport system permease protein